MLEKEQVEAMKALAHGVKLIASSITPVNALGTYDSAGQYVSSLTEALMGITRDLTTVADVMDSSAGEVNSGLVDIAEAIRELANAVRDRD
jgi:hypothetical protein